MSRPVSSRFFCCSLFFCGYVHTMKKRVLMWKHLGRNQGEGARTKEKKSKGRKKGRSGRRRGGLHDVHRAQREKHKETTGKG